MANRRPRQFPRLALLSLSLAALAALSFGPARLPRTGGAPAPEEVASEALDLGRELVRLRVRLLRGLAQEAAEGGLTLREGAAVARYHLAGEPRLPGVTTGLRLVSDLPGAADEDRCAALVLAHVRHLPPLSAEEVERLVLRLERERAEGRPGREE
jgi:hypothetical protein